MKRSKSWNKSVELFDQEKRYSASEAVALMKKTSTVKFDATAEVHFTLGINPKHADQQIRSSLTLPNGTGKSIRVIAFCSDEKIAEAKKSGAVEAGGADLIEKISKGWMDFDAAVATPDMMRNIAKVARVLGPRGLMPSPKTGGVTPDIAKAIKELQGGKIEIKNDKSGIVHLIFGKNSFDEKSLTENLEALIKTIIEIKPAGQKGIYIKNITINATMAPGIKVEGAGV